MAIKQCKQCLSSFPNSVGINNKQRNLQNRKYCLSCVPFGAKPGKKSANISLNGQSECVICGQIKPSGDFYHRNDNKNKPRSECKMCLANYYKDRWKQMKIDAVNSFGNKCHDCQQSFHLDCYDFHHLDESKKLFDWRGMQLTSKERRDEELKKCILLCANCHRIRHSK